MQLRGLEYEERLKILGFTNLETRRKRGNLLKIFKTEKGFEEVDLDRKGSEVREGSSRRHNSQIIRELKWDTHEE